MSSPNLQLLELQLRCTVSPELEALVETVRAMAQPARSTLGRGRAAKRFGLSAALRAQAAVVCAFIDGTPELSPGDVAALVSERVRLGRMLDDSEARAAVVGASDSDVNDAVHADVLRRLGALTDCASSADPQAVSS